MAFVPGSRRYAIAAAVLSVPAFLVSPWATVALLGVAGIVLWFYRDPDRTPPPAGIVAPADGRVSVVREEEGRVRVGVFMNVTDVHVNRAPFDGTVASIEHQPGGHRPAFSKDSDRNERVRIDFDGWAVVLIAGSFARRIEPYVEGGDAVARGDRIGHIALGSRADVVLPADVGLDDLRVATGDRVRAGETVIARSPRARARVA